jgi:hypothetical protein
MALQTRWASALVSHGWFAVASMFPPGCRAIGPDLKSTSGVIVNYNTSSQASSFLESLQAGNHGMCLES